MLTTKAAYPFAMAQYLTLFKDGENVTATMALKILETFQANRRALGTLSLETFLEKTRQHGSIDSWAFPGVDFTLYGLSLADFLTVVENAASCAAAGSRGLVS